MTSSKNSSKFLPQGDYISHNSTLGLQGGNATLNEFLHLTSAEKLAIAYLNANNTWSETNTFEHFIAIGTPIVPTAPVDTNTQQIASTAFVVAQGYAKQTTLNDDFATKDYVGEQIEDYGGNFVYIGFASNSAGANYSTTYNSSVHSYQAILTSNTSIETPVYTDFNGLWVPLQKQDTYIGYADLSDGTGFTETFSENKQYFAILKSATEILTRVQSNFNNLWIPIYNRSEVYEYNDFSVIQNVQMDGTGNVLGAGHLGPSGIHYKGLHNRIYFTWFSKYKDFALQVKTGEESAHWVAYVDCDTKVVSPSIKIPMTYNYALDTHTLPAINVSDDGYLIVMYEQLSANNTENAHNTPIDIWRSNTPEEIEDANTPGLHNFTKVATITGKHSYPNIIKDNDGILYTLFRSYNFDGAGHKHMTGIKSIDNGLTWTNLQGTIANTPTLIIEYSKPTGSTDWFCYKYIVECDKKYGINVVIQMNEYTGTTSLDGTTTNSNMKFMHFLHSDDGITWENVNSYLGTTGGFSKNIVTSGYLTYTEMDTNFMVDNVSLLADGSFHFQWAYMDDTTGVPYILYGYLVRPTSGMYSQELLNLYLNTFDINTNAWVRTDLLYLKDIGTNVTNNFIPYTGGISYFRANYTNKYDLIINRAIPDTRFTTTNPTINDVNNLYVGALCRIKTKTTSFSTLSVGDYFIVYHSAGVLNILGSSPNVPLVLDTDNTVELILQESLLLRTEDGGTNWTMLNSFKNTENYCFASSRFSWGVGDSSDYHLLIQYVSKLSGNTIPSTGDGDLKLILGKRI